MKRRLKPAFTGVLVSLSACAAAEAAGSAIVDDQPESSGWFVRLGGAINGGVKVAFHNSIQPTTLPPGYYDNGYVLADVSGLPYTQNWGYTTASQVQGDNLVFNRLDGLQRVGQLSGSDNGPQFGGRLTLGFDFVEFDFRKRDAKFGFEVGYGYSRFSATATGTTAGMATYTTDTFALNGVVPPTAPYNGSFNGPGPLIPLSPTSHQTASAATTDNFSGQVVANMHSIRFGPWVTLPLTKRISLGASFGYAALFTNPKFTVNETITSSNPNVAVPPPVSGVYGTSHFSPGVYFETRFEYRILGRLNAYVGADIQYNTGLSIFAPGREARFDFSSQYSGVAGLQWTY